MPNTANVAKVVVLIPPPQEPGEAPTNINKIRIKSVAFAILPTGNELKPEVLAFTAWKKEDRNRVGTASGASVLCHSINKIMIVLVKSKKAVVDSTNLE